MTKFDQWMTRAIAEAKLTRDSADVPVAALVFDEHDNLVSIGRNERELTGDPTAHAEGVAIQAAAAAAGTLAARGYNSRWSRLDPCTKWCWRDSAGAHPLPWGFGAWD